MKTKTKIITFLAIVSIAVTIYCIPAMAVTKWTTTVINWHVLGADEIRVTLVGLTDWTVANSTGNTSTTALNFTCAVKDCLWVNVSSEAASPTYQTQTVPALKIENYGTTTASWINLSTNYTWAAGDCFKLYYVNDTDGDAALDSVPTIASAQNLGTTNVSLRQSYAPGTLALRVWLFGNFSECQSQTNQTKIYVWAAMP